MSNPGLLAIKAIDGAQLTAAERAELTEGILATLAIGGYIKLTLTERDRISPGVLATLAIGKHTKLDRDELARFSPGVRMIVEKLL